MKFFSFALVCVVLLLLLSFASVFSLDSGLLMLAFCPLGAIFYPLLWVAIYRLSGEYSFSKRRG